MIIPGVVSATFRDYPAAWIIRQCRMADLKAVEWSEHAHVRPDDPVGAAALYEQTRAAGLEVAAYGSYYRLGGQEAPEKVFNQSLRSAAALHTPIIRIWAGTRPSAEVNEDVFAQLAAEAATVAEMAQKEGIKVAFEWHKNTLTDTNESAMELLKQAGHPNLYCLWQPTVDLSMAERLTGLELLGDRLLNLHIYYWPDGVKRPLAEGTGEWEQYLSRVDKTMPRYGLLEFVMGGTQDQFLTDAESLHRLLEHCQIGGE